MPSNKRYVYIIAGLAGVLLLSVFGCRQAYTPPVLQNNPNLLVVEGVINGVFGDSTTFTISRTQKTGDSLGAYTPELQAKVSILSSAGDAFALQERGNGVYSIPFFPLNKTETYQIKIVSHSGSQYLSDPVAIEDSPPIDSLTWQQQDTSNVIVSVNTHDPANNSHYYRWYFSETWEYNSGLVGELVLENGLIQFADSTNQIATCWRSDNSTDILLGNSTALGQDRISQQPIATILRGSQKISVRYSILVSQYVLTQAAYQYWLILQKNTQNLGTLFDPQPSQLRGNYHNVTNPNEPVIGYLSAGSITQKRLFIQRYQVVSWDTVAPSCPLKNIPQNSNYQVYTFADTTYYPYYFTTMPAGVELSLKTCLDCRSLGGSTQKPGFW